MNAAGFLARCEKCSWAKANPDGYCEAREAVVEAGQLRKRVAELEAEISNLLLQAKYPDPEDMPGELAAKFCPFNEPMHFHHDGCPACWAASHEGKRLPDSSVAAPEPAKVQEGLDPVREEALAVIRKLRRPFPEMTIECGCTEPGHFLRIYFDPECRTLTFAFRSYNGSLWKRIVDAVSKIFDGWESSDSCWLGLGDDAVRKIVAFCEECLEAPQDEEEGK